VGVERWRLAAEGKTFHRSTTMCCCEGEVWHGNKLVAKSLGTFKYLKRLDADRKLLPE
jgi:acyl-CoA thioesterase